MELVTLSPEMASLVGAVIGFLGGIISSFGLYWLRMNTRRQALRKAFYQEIEIPAEGIDAAVEGDHDSFAGPYHEEVPTVIYETQSSNIGLLTPDEVEALIKYYTTALVAQNQLQNFDDEDIATRFFEETLPTLKSHRDAAAETLEENL